MWIVKCALNSKEWLSFCIISALTALKVAMTGFKGFSEAPGSCLFY